MRLIPKMICACCVLFGTVLAQSPVTLTVDSKSTGTVIPERFIGESFETASIRLNNNHVKGYLFDSKNKQFLTLFKELGIKSLRIGGGTVDNVNVNPTYKDIDALFSFAKAGGIKVIYSLRLREAIPAEDAAIAKYVWDNYKEYLECFSIGNETDWHSFHLNDPDIYETTPGVPGSAYPSYLAKWRKVAKAVLDSVPGAKFSGPNTGSNYPVAGAKNTGYNRKPWTVNFAEDEKDSGVLMFVNQHNYVGQDAEGQKLVPEQMVEQMLSPVWDTVNYPALYNTCLTPALPAGIRFRLAESNSFSGGVLGGSNSCATALFALDYLHWWAAHNAYGVNFHTTQWRYNGTFYHDTSNNYFIYPMGYGIKAFNIGGHGKSLPVAISNPENVNITSYAVKDSKNLYVTVINKEYGKNKRNAAVTINSGNCSARASVMLLTIPDGNVFATSGLTLGGSAITNDGKWNGKWASVVSKGKGKYIINVPAASAAIVKISVR